MTKEIIRFKDVTKRFGALTVLDRFNFSVKTGEKVTLIGPSGSGKSTVLRILMTLEPFQEGSLELSGEPYHEPSGKGHFKASETHLRKIRSHVGMVFQSFNLFPHMSVLRNIIEAPIHVLGMKRGEAEARALELLSLVGLTDKRTIIRLSSLAVSSNVWQLPVHLQCDHAFFSSMNRPPRLILSLWAKCYPLFAASQKNMI